MFKGKVNDQYICLIRNENCCLSAKKIKICGKKRPMDRNTIDNEQYCNISSKQNKKNHLT